MLQDLKPPSIHPCSLVSFFLSCVLAWCYSFPGHCYQVYDARPPQLVIQVMGISLVLSQLHRDRDSYWLCLIAGCQGI